MNIRSFPRCLNFFLLLAVLLLATSCEEESPVVVEPPQAPNGYYLALEDQYPNPFALLDTAKVADPIQLDSMARPVEREGFYTGYMYLMEGNYQLVKVVDKKVIEEESVGGTASIENAGTGCGGRLVEYTLVQIDGSSTVFPVNTTGLHQVTYDSTTKEIVLLPIHDVSFVGRAVDTMGLEILFDENKNLDSTGGIWHKPEYEMFEGKWRVRFNCMNMIGGGGFDENGPVSETAYRIYTTLGGDEAFPEGGETSFVIGIEDVAAYDMDIVWYPETGWGIGPRKIEINPGNFRWQIDFEPYDEANEGELEEIPCDAISIILHGSVFEDLQQDCEQEAAIIDANPDREFAYLDKVEGKHEWKIEGLRFNDVDFKMITIDADGDDLAEGILVQKTENFTGFTSNIPDTFNGYFRPKGGDAFRITDTASYNISIFTKNEGVKWNVYFERNE